MVDLEEEYPDARREGRFNWDVCLQPTSSARCLRAVIILLGSIEPDVLSAT